MANEKPDDDDDDDGIFDFSFSTEDIEAAMGADEEDAPEVTAKPTRKPPSAENLRAFEDFIRQNDLGELPRHLIGGVDDTSEFVEHFLRAVKSDYDATGDGSYDCVLKFRYAATEDGLTRFLSAVRQRVSRIRKEASHHIPKFYVVTDSKILFADEGAAVVRMRRMSAQVYEDWFSDMRSRKAVAISTNNRLKDLL